jgi:hypothetical protein
LERTRNRLFRDAKFVACVSSKCVVGHQLKCDGPGKFGLKTAPHINGSQFFFFG